jgi:hypothetical protein
MGRKFIDELATRLNAKEQYDAWVTGKHDAKQLKLLPLHQSMQPLPVVTSEDQREASLTRQAIRVAVLNQQPDLALLEKHGWTLDDVQSLAQIMRRRNTTAD